MNLFKMEGNTPKSNSCWNTPLSCFQVQQEDSGSRGGDWCVTEMAPQASGREQAGGGPPWHGHPTPGVLCSAAVPHFKTRSLAQKYSQRVTRSVKCLPETLSGLVGGEGTVSSRNDTHHLWHSLLPLRFSQKLFK